MLLILILGAFVTQESRAIAGESCDAALNFDTQRILQ